MSKEDIYYDIRTREAYENRVMQYEKKAGEYLERINCMIADKSASSIIQFLAIFNEPDVLAHYVSASVDMTYAYIIANIVIGEVRAQKMTSFFVQGSSLKELIDIIRQIKFLLWEVEFECGADAEVRLYEYLSLHGITPEAMSMIIFIGGMDKQKCYLTLACLYLEHDKIDDACRILSYGMEKLPEAEEIAAMYQQLCTRIGISKQETGNGE